MANYRYYLFAYVSDLLAMWRVGLFLAQSNVSVIESMDVKGVPPAVETGLKGVCAVMRCCLFLDGTHSHSRHVVELSDTHSRQSP